jgi:hypothetical protein
VEAAVESGCADVLAAGCVLGPEAEHAVVPGAEVDLVFVALFVVVVVVAERCAHVEHAEPLVIASW